MASLEQCYGMVFFIGVILIFTLARELHYFYITFTPRTMQTKNNCLLCKPADKGVDAGRSWRASGGGHHPRGRTLHRLHAGRQDLQQEARLGVSYLAESNEIQ